MRRSLTLFLALLLLAGCATTNGVPTDSVPLAASELPRTLAVLPFVALPEREEQARLVRNMIYGSLSATPYDVLKLQVVEERLVRAGLGDPKALAETNPAELARLLRVDGLLYGELTHWDRIFLLAYSQIAAGAHIRLVDGRNGQTLFERKEVSRSHAGDAPTSPFGAALTLLKTVRNLREIELVRASDDLVRDLLKGIPTPPPGAARRPPAFTKFVKALSPSADAPADAPLRAGDTVTVIAHGQPGAVGSFDIAPVAKNLTLEETRDEGIYIDRYTVKPGDNGKDVYVVARLADTVGRVAEREDVLGRFEVDTAPPATPAGISVSLKERALQLAWAQNQEPDLAAYRVYRSDSPLTGFTPVATTEVPAYRDELAGMRYYRVSALDKARNESAPSQTVTLPVLTSPLRGVITKESFLVPAHSPYVVEGSVSVAEGATLHILPGVVVRFAPGADGIVVRDGTLVARGSQDRRVVFTSGSERPAPGDFKSAVRVEAKAGQTSLLEHVTVEHAAVGLKVASGGLEVLQAEIAGNLQGGIEVSDTGLLKLSQSRVAGHKSGGGVTVQGFGRASLRGNRILDNAWAVVNYSGNQVDARENWWGNATPDDALFVGDIDRRGPLSQP